MVKRKKRHERERETNFHDVQATLIYAREAAGEFRHTSERGDRAGIYDSG